MKRLALLAALILLCVLITPARAAEPPLRVDNATSAIELTREAPGDRLTLSVYVFSGSAVTETIGLRQELDPTRFEVLSTSATTGTAEVVYSKTYGQPELAVAVRWSGEAWLDHPASITIQLLVRSDAPAGIVMLPVNASNAAGVSASATEAVRVCCYTWPAPIAPPAATYRTYLALARGGGRASYQRFLAVARR